MQDKVSPVIASFFFISLNTVGDDTPLRQLQSQVRRTPSHSKGLNISGFLSAEKMRMTSSLHTFRSRLIIIMKGDVDSHIRLLQNHRESGDICKPVTLIQPAASRHRSFRFYGKRIRADHRAPFPISLHPVHFCRIAFAPQKIQPFFRILFYHKLIPFFLCTHISSPC